MRRAVGIISVILMIIGVMGCMQAIAEEGNELEELVGLKVNIVYQISSRGTSYNLGTLNCKGVIVGVKESWIIVLTGKRYVWCYIPTIRKIEILDKEYKPNLYES